MNAPAAPAFPSETASIGSPWRWSELLSVAGLALVPILVKFICYPTYPGSDDAFIHLTIVRNLLHGGGWGINPGEPVNLSSSPLYTGLVALCSLLGWDALNAAMTLSAVAGFGALVALYGLFISLGVGRTARLAGIGFAAFNMHFWRWNGIGMETTLSVFLVTLAFWSYHRADGPGHAPAWRYLLTGLLAGLAMLTRFELALAIGCCGLREILVYRTPGRVLRACLLMSGAFLVTVAPWFLFCRSYFHLILPTTFYAKTTHGLLLWNPMVASELLKVAGSAEIVPILGVGGLFVAALWRRRAGGFGASVLARLDVYLFPLLLALFYYLKTPNLQSAGRYYLPGVHLLAAALACAFDALAFSLPVRAARMLGLALVAVQALLSLGFNQQRVTPVLRRFQENYWQTARDAAGFIRSRARPDRKLNVLVEVDIGMLSYYAGGVCYFHDGGALATPSLRDLTVPQQLERTRPDLVIEMLGAQPGGTICAGLPALTPVWSREFLSHSVTDPGAHYHCTVFENQP